MSRVLRIACVTIALFSLAALPAWAQNKPGGKGPGGGFGGGRSGSTPTLEKARVTVLFLKTDNAMDMIPKLLESSSVTGVKVDLKTRRATMMYSGVTTGLEKIEQAGATYGVKLLSPALVEFTARKTGGQTNLNELRDAVRQTVRDILTISSTDLLVAADLESTDWAQLFADTKGRGYELTGKSHAFLTVNWTGSAPEAGKEDPTAKAIGAMRGVLVVKPVAGEGQALIVSTPDVTGAALGKAAKDSGSKLGKVVPGWPPPPAENP